MECTITNDDRVAMAEVDYIIHHMNERYINLIPQNVLDFIAILKKRNLDIYVDPKLPLEEQNLKEFTRYFLMILNLKYWCNDERKKEILAMMENNQKAIDERVNNIFEQAQSVQGSSSNQSEAVNRPKEITVANQVPVQNENINNNEEHKNAIEQLQEETAMAQAESQGFFKKLINKLKSLIKK